MNVGELRELLEDLDDEMEVLLAEQPRYPQEYNVGEATEVNIKGKKYFYITEGSQRGYLPEDVRDQLDF
jgi:hypothetical protein